MWQHRQQQHSRSREHHKQCTYLCRITLLAMLPAHAVLLLSLETIRTSPAALRVAFPLSRPGSRLSNAPLASLLGEAQQAVGAAAAAHCSSKGKFTRQLQEQQQAQYFKCLASCQAARKWCWRHRGVEDCQALCGRRRGMTHLCLDASGPHEPFVERMWMEQEQAFMASAFQQ
ncbi:hypothetical protein COO60DRAFT_1495080 [Scenedesmus sp. NREL 46B-D3]|nr:hypothetical protein COO60DRAFT_1495080 [Scenedesmus sp. NREL 46B-D3]